MLRVCSLNKYAKTMLIRQDTVIIITGASSGLGAALAVELAKYGANLAICARRNDRLQEVAQRAEEAGATVLALPCDVSKKEAAEDFVQQCLQRFGKVDVLINNAGRGNFGAVEHTSQQQVESMFSLNVFSLWYMTAPLLPLMKEQGSGHIINIASTAGKFGFPYNSAYVAAKHAVVGFTASLRAELMGTGVHATVVCPAGIITEWADATEGSSIGNLFAEGIKRSRSIARERNIPFAPLQRMMSAEDAAHIVIDCILHPPLSDVFTHPGTQELALLAAQNRSEFEQLMLPFYIGTQQAYQEQLHSSSEQNSQP